jgi:hypothetical protein
MSIVQPSLKFLTLHLWSLRARACVHPPSTLKACSCMQNGRCFQNSPSAPLFTVNNPFRKSIGACSLIFPFWYEPWLKLAGSGSLALRLSATSYGSSLAAEPGTLSAETATLQAGAHSSRVMHHASRTMRHSMLPGGPCLYSLILFFNSKPMSLQQRILSLSMERAL